MRQAGYVWACTCGKGGVLTVSVRGDGDEMEAGRIGMRDTASAHLRGDSTGHVMTWGVAAQVVRRKQPLPPLSWTGWTP